METRFGIKDFFLFLFIGVLIVLVALASYQFDRQYDRVQLTYQETQTLAQDLNRIKRDIAEIDGNVLDLQERIDRGVAVVPGGATGGGPTTRPGGDPEASASLEPGKGRNGQTDPFYQIEEAASQPDFARGGWFLDNFGTKIGRITPLVSSDIYATWVQNLVQEPLAQQDPYTLEWLPRLARRWDISEDGLVMTFYLRRNATFSDGVPVTADDVIFTFDWIMNPDVQADRTRSYLTESFEKVEKIDDHTVRFTFKKPYFLNFNYAAGPDVAVMPKHFYEKYTPTQFNEHVGLLMGSGPYMVEGGPDIWTPGNGVTLVRNPRYWGAEPTVERINYTEIESEDTQAVRFRNREQDLFRGTPELYVKLVNDPEVMSFAQDQRHPSPYKGYTYIGWNQQRETAGARRSTFFADKRVRRAMTMLLDRERMNREIFEGLYTSASGPFDPEGAQSDPNVKPLPFDLEQARSLLREAGFEDRNGDGLIENAAGQPLEFTLTYPGGSVIYEKIVLFLRDNFARGGVKMNAERVDWPVLIRRMNAKDFDAVILGWSSTTESDPYQIFHSSQIEATGDNRISYRNPELDKAIEEARRTMDRDERMKLWQAVHRILAEDQPYTFLFNRPNLYLMNQRVKNIDKSKVGLNYEPLHSTLFPWYIPQGQQEMTR